MRNRRHIFLTAGLIVCFAGTAAAQKENAQSSVTLTGGLTIIFTSKTDPPSHERVSPGSVQVRGSENTVHRIFVDRQNKIYFGYDLEVEPILDSNQYRLIIKPLSKPPILLGPPKARRGGAGAAGVEQMLGVTLALTDLTSLSLPKYPPPQLVHDGDTLALDILVNSQTGVKIIDLVKILSPAKAAQAQSQATEGATQGDRQAAIDLTLEMIQLRVTNSRLLINGQIVVGTEQGSGPGVAGSLIWFYLPGYGRFILSLTQQAGYDFQKAGVVDGRKLSFSSDGNRIEWVSTSLVVPSVDETLNLWVLRDSQYQPDISTDNSPYLMGAANHLKSLMSRH